MTGQKKLKNKPAVPEISFQELRSGKKIREKFSPHTKKLQKRLSQHHFGL